MKTPLVKQKKIYELHYHLLTQNKKQKKNYMKMTLVKTKKKFELHILPQNKDKRKKKLINYINTKTMTTEKKINKKNKKI